MNKKQGMIIFFAVVAVTLIVIFTPRYKIFWIDSDNFVKTEQTSSLYKRSQGKEHLYWDKVALYSGATIIVAGIFVFTLRNKRG